MVFDFLQVLLTLLRAAAHRLPFPPLRTQTLPVDGMRADAATSVADTAWASSFRAYEVHGLYRDGSMILQGMRTGPRIESRDLCDFSSGGLPCCHRVGRIAYPSYVLEYRHAHIEAEDTVDCGDAVDRIRRRPAFACLLSVAAVDVDRHREGRVGLMVEDSRAASRGTRR